MNEQHLDWLNAFDKDELKDFIQELIKATADDRIAAIVHEWHESALVIKNPPVELAMNEQRAKEILGEFPEDNVAYNLDDEWTSPYVKWDPKDNVVRIDAWLKLEQLEAIVWWIKNKGSEAR